MSRQARGRDIAKERERETTGGAERGKRHLRLYARRQRSPDDLRLSGSGGGSSLVVLPPELHGTIDCQADKA